MHVAHTRYVHRMFVFRPYLEKYGVRISQRLTWRRPLNPWSLDSTIEKHDAKGGQFAHDTLKFWDAKHTPVQRIKVLKKRSARLEGSHDGWGHKGLQGVTRVGWVTKGFKGHKGARSHGCRTARG